MESLNRPVTVYDIARQAGVSPSTVSRVITGAAPVAADKEARVRAVMSRVDYQPNGYARGLLKRESRVLGMILPDISNPFFSRLFLEMERQARATGYVLLLGNTLNAGGPEMGDPERLYLRRMVEHRVDGVIYMGGRVNTVEPDPGVADDMARVAARVPLVIVNGHMPGTAIRRVNADEASGMRQLVDHLHGLGHRDLALVGGRAGTTPWEIKRRAFMDALAAHGLSCPDSRILPLGFDFEAGVEAFRRLRGDDGRRGGGPSALLGVNDNVAIGVLRQALAAGCRPPAEFSVTGFDDIPMAGWFLPALTTVSQNFGGLARAAVATLVDLIEGRDAPAESVVPVRLEIRQSSGPADLSQGLH